MPFRVGAIPFAGYEFLFLARHLGLLADSGVRLVDMRSNTDVIRALATRRLEAAALTLDEVLAATHDGVPLKVVLVLNVSAGADAVMGRPPIDEAADAIGHRVGVEGSAVGALMLASFLAAGVLTPADIEQVPVPLAESAEAYLSGRVDVVITAEPWATQLAKAGAQRLFDSRAIPGRIVDVLAVRADALPAHAAALQRLVDGHFAAQGRFSSQSAALAPAVAERMGISPQEVLTSFQGLELPGLVRNQALLRPGGDIAKGLPGLAALLLRQGLVDAPIDTRDLIDARWVGVR
jgi:NitT/TauT family transport system substrate-binding protein